jgi:hypothetical protein
MAEIRRRRALMVWAVLGAAVLVGAVAALLIASLSGNPRGGSAPSPSASDPPSSPPPTSATTGPNDEVDPEVLDQGWVPEPITRNPEVYARAALEAAGTFDTTLSSRADWVAWLQTWFTPSPLYDNEQDALDQMTRYQAELDQAVVLPPKLWDDLAREDGRVTAHVSGDIEYLELPETTEKKMWTATADLVMTYTRAAPDGEVSYDETVRVSVQVVCDGQSVPTPSSAQRAGDCKVVRFFDEAVG